MRLLGISLSPTPKYLSRRVGAAVALFLPWVYSTKLHTSWHDPNSIRKMPALICGEAKSNTQNELHCLQLEARHSRIEFQKN